MRPATARDENDSSSSWVEPAASAEPPGTTQRRIATIRIKVRTGAARWKHTPARDFLNAMNDVAWMLENLWGPIVAVTAADGGRTNGLISSTTVTASLLPEAPRVSVLLSRASLTRELVLGSGAFAVHLLPADRRGLELFRELGFRSGRDGSKLDDVATHVGSVGAPILTDAVSYIEARVAQTVDAEDVTVVVGDVVAGARLREGPCLTIEHVRDRLPAAWLDEWERRRERELDDARRFRR